jgi:RNA-directed DNA polymerase
MEEQQKTQSGPEQGNRGEAPKSGPRGAESMTAKGVTESLPDNDRLMEAICERENLKQALKRVKANKGAPGVDGMTVQALPAYLREHWPKIREQLLSGRYEPQPVKRVEIPKADGSMRQLGIPCTVDRLIQQAALQVLQKQWDPSFSESSYGFRPGRSAHQAVEQAQRHIQSGYGWVVDLDLEKYFDRVNHDILMSRVAKRISDKRVLKLIRGFLTAGVLEQGLVKATDEGTPQGGPLSPLLSNLLLDELDRELERRDLRFVRYADDSNVYVRTERAGQRVMRSLKAFLTKRLKLKVNESKSAVARPEQRKFLGLTFTRGQQAKRRIAPKAVLRFKERIREITQRTRGASIEQVAEELKRYLTGWRGYFGFCETPSVLQRLDEWVRRRLRCFLWKQWKRGRTRFKELTVRGVGKDLAAQTAGSPHGPWRLSCSPALAIALPNRYFASLDIPSVGPDRSTNPNRRVRTRTHGGVGGVGP